MWRLGAWEEFLNRLTRENNAQLGKTYTYTYDTAGNITSKKTYAYTAGTLGSVQSTKTYTYSNSNWGDQLTAYNGAAITYDANGNPLTYNNGFKYRGYYYDTETGLYYLNSRYYDPAVGRFINPDIYINANGDLTGFKILGE